MQAGQSKSMSKKCKKWKKRIEKKNGAEKNYKFDPPLKSRYLAGEASNSLVGADFDKYKKHRLLLAQAKAVVDDKPPAFRMKAYYDKDKLEEDARLAIMNCRMNLDLARDTNKKFRMEAKVDCWKLSQLILNTEQSFLKSEYKDIMIRNRHLYECLDNLSSEYSPQLMAKDWKRLKSVIEQQSKYRRFKDECKYPSITDVSLGIEQKAAEAPLERARCFFDLELEQTKSPLGRIVFELYSDYAPRACANFEAFCKGHNGLTYEGTPFHRILSDYACQGGDVTKFNGLGAASIYDHMPPAPRENCPLRHMCPGVLSSYHDQHAPCDSKFNLSFRPLTSMDGKKLVFGKVIKGIPVLSKVDRCLRKQVWKTASESDCCKMRAMANNMACKTTSSQLAAVAFANIKRSAQVAEMHVKA